MKGFVWRKWVVQEKELFYRFGLESLFKQRVVCIEESFRKRCCFEIYLRNLSEGKTLKQSFGGRVIAFHSQSWERSQKAFHYPIKISPELFVTATQSQQKRYGLRFPRAKVIWIPAEAAFGTGTHVTTFLCLRELTKRKPFSSLIDIGTGSGILAITSAKLGCQKTYAIDYDRTAIRVARLNAKRNQVKVHWKVDRLETFQPKIKAEVVVANLFSEMLIQRARKIASWTQKGGTLILSGIRSYQKLEVKKAFYFLREIGDFQKEEWCCMVFQK